MAITAYALAGTMRDLSISRGSTILSYCRSCDLYSVLSSFYFSAGLSETRSELDCFFDRDMDWSCTCSVCTKALVIFII